MCAGGRERGGILERLTMLPVVRRVAPQQFDERVNQRPDVLRVGMVWLGMMDRLGARRLEPAAEDLVGSRGQNIGNDAQMTGCGHHCSARLKRKIYACLACASRQGTVVGCGV